MSSGLVVAEVDGSAKGLQIRVAEKCGFKKALRTLYQGKPTIVFAQYGSDV
jgi:hypothetical protein